MRIFRYVKTLLMVVSIAMLSACGGSGSDNTNGSVTLVVNKTSVGTGSTFSGTVTFVSPISTAYNGKSVSILSDNTSLIPNGSGFLNNSGVANIPLQPLSVITTPKTVNLVAVVDGIRSTSVQVTVTTPTLTLAPPADSTFAATGSTNQTVRFVAENLALTFKDSLGNPVQNQNITLSVKTINNQRLGDQVVFFPTAGTEIIAPPGKITVVTDSRGIANVPVSIDILTPSFAPSQHVITVLWEAEADIIGHNNTVLTFMASGSTQLTVTN